MKKLVKEQKGVTLIALVVTIVILIILVAVSMTMVLENNGIFEQAKKGANAMADAETNEQKGFNSMSEEIDKILVGNASSENPSEPEEKPKKIEDAKNSREEFTNNRNILEDSKGNRVVIPGGFKISSDSGNTVGQGIVIEDVSASGDGDVKGSQFVWVPVGKFITDDGTEKNIKLGRYSFDMKSVQLIQDAKDYKQKVYIQR